MAGWLCIICFHEFPDEGVRKQPERVGMVLFVLIGLALIAVALVCAWSLVREGFSLQIAVYAALALAFGFGAISMGRQFGRGVKAICPACGKPQGVRADSRIADEMRKRRAAG